MESFQTLDETNALTLINDVHREIASDLRLYPDLTVDVSLVAGTATYALPASLARIWNVVYIDGITQGQPLLATNIDELDYKYPTWRTAPSARPYMYYERAGQLGLYPAPDTTTAGGTPVARVYYAEVSSNDLEIRDELPGSVKSIDAWVYGACLKHAIQRGDQRMGVFKSEYKAAFEKALGWSYGRTPRDKPSIRFNTPRVRRY